MRLSELNPQAEGNPMSKEGDMVWTLFFECPLCRNRTQVAIHGGDAVHPIWKCTPSPEVILNSIETASDWVTRLGSLTLEPSLQQLPHPRQVKCGAHFHITKGEIILK